MRSTGTNDEGATALAKVRAVARPAMPGRPWFLALAAAVTVGAAGLVLPATAASASASVAAPAAVAGTVSHSYDGSQGAIVTDSTGFAMVAGDTAGDVMLFTRAYTATKWTSREIYNAGTGDGEFYYPAIASNGGTTLAIVATDASTGTVESWIGKLGHSFTEHLVASGDDYSLTPAVTYSAAGGNFIATDTDRSGNVEFWYSGSGGSWTGQQVVSGRSVAFDQAALVATDKGVLVVADDDRTQLDVFYQPYFASGWTLTSLDGSSLLFDPSVTWTGSQAVVAADSYDGITGVYSLDTLAYSDTGVFQATTPTGYASGAQPYSTGIIWTGFDLDVVSYSGSAVNFFYSTGTGQFGTQTVASDSETAGTFGTDPEVAYGDGVGEVTDSNTGGPLYVWSQPDGGTTWAKHRVAG